MERGLNEREAQAITDAISTEPDFLDEDPEDDADEELSCWANDG
jgi:hypothetical protein